MDKEQWKTVYKVTTVYRESAMICGLLSLPYSVYEVTVPEIGYIFAFDSLENAVEFAHRSSQFAIWEAKAVIAKDVPMKMLRYNLVYNDNIRAFWRGKMSSCQETTPIGGTVFCSKLQLVRRIR